jgi:hypothetical protein
MVLGTSRWAHWTSDIWLMCVTNHQASQNGMWLRPCEPRVHFMNGHDAWFNINSYIKGATWRQDRHQWRSTLQTHVLGFYGGYVF